LLGLKNIWPHKLDAKYALPRRSWTKAGKSFLEIRSSISRGSRSSCLGAQGKCAEIDGVQIMSETRDKFWEGVFKGLNDELQWLQSADRLKHGADLLFAAYLKSCELSPEERSQTEDRNMDGIATLLYGLAMENILKAALLKEKIAKIKPDGRIDWNFIDGARDHDLLLICRSSKLLILNPNQGKLLERMSAFVHWAGKYPTPLALKDEKGKKDYKGLLLSNQPKAAPVTMPIEFQTEDKIKFDEIYHILWEKAFPFDLGQTIA
jgi:hypothetical protein